MHKILQQIQDSLKAIGKLEKAQWLENYVKHDIKSRGVGIPEIREVIISTNCTFKITEKPVSEQISLLDDLMSQVYTEDKLTAVLYLQLFWKETNTQEKLDIISKWFDKNLITDWNVCDWLCVRILSPMVDNYTKPTLTELSKWNTSKNLWKARASLVPFAQAKTINQHQAIIEKFSTVLIKRPERFCKTAVGWALREISRNNQKFVLDFLADNAEHTSKEVIRNATKYIRKQENANKK